MSPYATAGNAKNAEKNSKGGGVGGKKKITSPKTGEVKKETKVTEDSPNKEEQATE